MSEASTAGHGEARQGWAGPGKTRQARNITLTRGIKMSGTKGTKPGKRKGRVNRYGVEVVYIGATIPRKLVDRMDKAVAAEGITLSHLVERILKKEFGE